MTRWVLTLFSALWGVAAAAGEVTVAVASNFLTTAEQIATVFEAETGHSVVLSHGATGQLYAQIEAGAPFDVFLAPQEIPTGPPTEYHSAYLALMQTNRVVFPIAKTIIYMNLFFGGATSWGIFAIKVFALYMVSVLIGVVMPRFRVEQSIRFFLKWGLPFGVLAILAV